MVAGVGSKVPVRSSPTAEPNRRAAPPSRWSRR